MQSFLRKIRHRAIIKKLSLLESASVLDTSCQDGGFLSVLLENNQEKNIKLFGVDIDEKEIEKAQKLLPQANFTVTDNKNIPFPEKSFDVVISSMTLHHMSNPSSSIREMKRVLKDGGCLYLIDLIAQGNMFYSILKHIKCPEPYHFEKFYFLPDVEKLLLENGLKIKKVDRVIIFPTVSIAMPVLVLQIQVP